MNYWLISDTHFNHTRLDEWGGRSGSWEETMMKGIAKNVKSDDVLIHMGDVCIGNDVKVHGELFGHVIPKEISSFRGIIGFAKAILVRGNHDKKSAQWYTEHGWDFVCDGLELLYMGHYLHLTHRPARPQGNTTWNIHGHTHGNMHRSEEYTEFYSDKYHIDISPEVVGYEPLRLDTLMKKYKV